MRLRVLQYIYDHLYSIQVGFRAADGLFFYTFAHPTIVPTRIPVARGYTYGIPGLEVIQVYCLRYMYGVYGQYVKSMQNL